MALVLVSSGCIYRTSKTLIYETDITFVDAIEASNTVGNIELQGEADRKSDVHIRTEKRVTTYSLFGLLNPDRYLERIITTEVLEDGTAMLATEAIPQTSTWWYAVTPEIKRSIYAPVSTDAELRMDVGNLQVNNITGAVAANVDVGNCTLDTIRGSVQATVNVGNFEAQTINGPINANVDAGDINIHADALVGNNYFGVNVGSVMVSLPSATQFRYKLDVDVGNIGSGGFDIAATHPDVTGAHAEGCVQGNCNASAYVDASVDVGDIVFSER